MSAKDVARIGLGAFRKGQVVVIAGMRNQLLALVVISAVAASFGGFSGLTWLAFWAAGTAPTNATPDPSLTLARNRWWIACGVGSAAILICVLGPGVRFHP
jgi:hypothetical protein